jgi:hypothetical protein
MDPRGVPVSGCDVGRRRGVCPTAGRCLKIYLWDSPASMSIHEESTIAAEGPMMGVFNNLVMYKQNVPQTRLDGTCGRVG